MVGEQFQRLLTPLIPYLSAPAAADDRPRPPSWRLSPWAVVSYLLGGTLDDQLRPWIASARAAQRWNG